MTDLPPAFTVDNLAAHFQRPRSWVLEQKRSGLLPFHGTSRRPWFTPSDVAAFIEASRVERNVSPATGRRTRRRAA